MYRNRRRARQNDDVRLYANKISSLSKDDCISVAWYLFEMTKENHGDALSDNDDFYNIFVELAKTLGLKERLKHVLSEYVNIFLKEDSLHYYLETPKKEDYEENEYGTGRTKKDSPVFEEDRDLARYMDFYSYDEIGKNFYRVMMASGNDVYNQLIYNTFFTTAKKISSKYYDKAPERIVKKARDIKKVKFIVDALGLSEKEAEYVLVRYRKISVQYLYSCFDSISNSTNEIYANLLGLSNKEFSKIVRADQKLREYGFINETNGFNISVIECIENNDLSLYFSDFVKPVDLKDTYDLNSFCVPKENTAIYKGMLESENPISLLLYGSPGAGKTEFAKALVKSTGKKALIFKNEAEVDERNDILGRLNCFLSLNDNDSILIIDEADTLLKTTQMLFFGPAYSSTTKGIVNKMLECSKNKVIWIVNRKSQIDESTLRRFTASYKFNAMSQQLLESIAEKKLDIIDVDADTKNKIIKMLSKYKVTGASVDNMIKAIKSMPKNGNILKNIEIVLTDNSTLLYGKSAMRENVNDSYDISVLNTSTSAERIMKMLENAKKFADKNPGSGAVRMLFFGLSGTGKTEFARYIAGKLDKKILLKRPSDILDKYVGGSEANIKEAFEEAARNDQILLFDEADTFFADRSNAKNSWERTQVNEFLTQLEEFPGIVICTTNLRQIMDPAMLRRFHITVEFKEMETTGVKKLLEKFFPSFEFNDVQLAKLTAYKTVTPGDFGRLYGTIRFMDEEEVNSDYIIQELCNIQKDKMEGENSSGRRIGFCA